MRALVSSLLELQELELVLEESRILHQDRAADRTAEVRAKVEALRKRVPQQSLRRFDRLRRNGLGAVRESGGVCMGCFLNVPVGDLNRMRRGEAEWICPNCGRFLLLEADD